MRKNFTEGWAKFSFQKAHVMQPFGDSLRTRLFARNSWPVNKNVCAFNKFLSCQNTPQNVRKVQKSKDRFRVQELPNLYSIYQKLWYNKYNFCVPTERYREFIGNGPQNETRSVRSPEVICLEKRSKSLCFEGTVKYTE